MNNSSSQQRFKTPHVFWGRSRFNCEALDAIFGALGCSRSLCSTAWCNSRDAISRGRLRKPQRKETRFLKVTFSAPGPVASTQKGHFLKVTFLCFGQLTNTQKGHFLKVSLFECPNCRFAVLFFLPLCGPLFATTYIYIYIVLTVWVWLLKVWHANMTSRHGREN